MKRLFAFALVLAAIVPAVASQTSDSFTGRWEGTVTIQRPDGTESEPNPLLLNLVQTGQEVTGTAGPTSDQQPIEKGVVVDGKASFQVQLPGPLYKFTLAIVDGRLQGEMTGERDGVVRVRGTVAAAKAK